MVSVSRLQNNNLSKLLFFTIVAFNTIVRDFSFAYNLNVNFFSRLNYVERTKDRSKKIKLDTLG